ncbi:MAG: beta-lactamase family protein [Chloroflexi bacterium]|nr:beta-lactamase family protein [Chloroflexota bacterium]
MSKTPLLDGVGYADRWLSFRQQLREIPGLVAAICLDGEMLLNKGYGLANLERQTPMTPDRIFRVASHSKTFTATAIMRLAEQGRLRLDDALGTYLPWLGGAPAIGQASIRQVLNHAAGIVRDGYDADYWQLDGDFPRTDRLQQLTLTQGAILPPNDAFKYSNIGYGLLGLIVEAASGLDYNRYVRQEIVERLGLRDTGPDIDLDPGLGERLVTGYSARRPGLPRRPLSRAPTHALAPATGFYSTAADLCRYASAHCFGNLELLTDASKREMQHPAWSIDQTEDRYGLGLVIQQYGERRMIGHGGSFPGESTQTLVDPVGRLVVVVLVNTNGPDRLAGALASSVVRILDASVRRGRAAVAAAWPAERFTGRFANLWGVTDVVAFGGALVALNPEDDDPVQQVTELRVLDADTLAIASTIGYGAQGESIRYVRDGSGRTTRIVRAGISAAPQELP